MSHGIHKFTGQGVLQDRGLRRHPGRTNTQRYLPNTGVSQLKKDSLWTVSARPRTSGQKRSPRSGLVARFVDHPPFVAFDQIYSFDRDTLVNSIPRPETIPIEQEESFRSAAGELFDRVMQAADNAGATDEDRALNYLTVRYPSIYATAADAFGRNESLTAITVCPSSLSTAGHKSVLHKRDA
jgi:hypothetical protein